MGNPASRYEPINNDYLFNAIPSTNENLSHRHRFVDESSDSLILIWLDAQSNGNDLESLRSKKLLLEINQDCLFYDNCNLFLHDAEAGIFENKKILLIVSGSFYKIISSGWNMSNSIPSVIIFCRHSYKYVSSKKDYVADICTDHESLTNCIQREMRSLKLNLFENLPLKSIRSLTSSAQDVVHNGPYFTYILFINVLRRMPQTKQVQEAMLNKCEDYYRNNKKYLAEIDHFRRNYTCDQAVKWYTRDSFVYRLVNRAFRTEDITLWYIFRDYIIDLCIQLEKVHEDQKERFGHRCLTLYHGQTKMSVSELEHIRSNIGSLVATNAFLSTSSDYEIALGFAMGALDNNTSKAVLYEIVVHTAEAKNIIFIDVLDHLSSRKEAEKMNEEEKEFLFSIGSVFQIENVYYNADINVWNIQMKATDAGTSAIGQQIESIQEQFQIGNVNLLFGRLMLDMGYYDEADSYFQLMLEVLPKNHEDLGSVYDFMGDLKLRTTNWNEALKYLHMAYKIKKKDRSSKEDLGITLNNIGNYHKAIGNNVLALKFYRESLACVTNPTNTVITRLNIGTILKINEQYLQALEIYHESLYLLQKIDPCPYAELIICQGLIGDLYCAQYEYNDAEAFYLTAFELAKKCLFMNDLRIIRCIDALADIYEKQDNGSQCRSIDFCQQQLVLYEQNLVENHLTIAHILMKLGKLSNDILHYQRALSIFQSNRHRDHASTANCLMCIAQHHDKQKMYEEALSFYTRAFQIQKKIYPSNHSLILQTEILLNRVDRKYKSQLVS